jgi:hypothetical protein
VTHFRSMFDSDYAGVWDLDGRERIVTITKVVPGAVGGHQGRKKSNKAILHVRELDKPLVCNVTNARTIAGLYGADTRTWVGKRITLYPTTTQFGPDTVDCIRVRPTMPSGEGERVESKPVDQGVRAKQDRAARKAEHPAAPLGAATTADELLEAIKACAPWVTENHEARWPKVVEQCARLGVAVADARVALELGAEGA